MFGSYFAPGHQYALAAAVLGIACAVVCWHRGQRTWALWLLTCSALCLRLFAATLDPYLNQWDECFHALVAKRMMDDPFTPALYAKGVLPTTDFWTHSHLWLHKPPFFLWQISASLAIFGIEPWAVRIPSALWLTALLPVTYRMGRLLVDERVGWIVALLATCSYYLLELTAGAVTTDHNDAVFIAAVACSWWALLELWNDGRSRWAVLAGVLSACAILTKVFVGGVVFLPWLVVVLMRRDRKAWMDLLLGARFALGISALWFGSLAIRFPEELAAQFAFDTGHLGEVVEGHTGDATFHFEVIDQLMSPFTWWLVIPAYSLLVWHVQRKEHRVFLIALFTVIHVVFAWASTKMPSFTMALLPLYLTALTTALVTLVDVMIVERYRKWVLLVAPLVLAGFFLNIEVLQHRHTLASPPKDHQQWRQQQIEAMPILARLKDIIPDHAHSVVYHVPALHHLQFMFTTGIEATDQMPHEADVERLHKLGYKVYTVQDGEPYELFPTGVILIKDDLLRFPDVGRPN